MQAAAKKISRSTAGNVLIILFLAGVALVMFMPLLYMLLQSVKPPEEIFLFPPRFWVNRPTGDNFKNLFALASDLWVPFSRYLFNSLFVTVTTTALQVVLASMAAYPLAKHKFMGKGFFFNIVVLALLFTYDVVFLPQYILISSLGWVDKYISLILPSAAYPLGLYLMRQNMMSFPDSVLESARIDGGSEATLFWRIVMPSMKPVWMTMVVFSFSALWSRTDISFIYSEQLKSLPTLLQQISAGGVVTRMGVGAATSVILVLPPILIFILAQSKVIETMASSGMKD
jgi:ABC-type glycerol-3-phosphate transport system permease component